MDGNAIRTRRSSVTRCWSSSGTLKSTRIKTVFPATGTSWIVFLGMVALPSWTEWKIVARKIAVIQLAIVVFGNAHYIDSLPGVQGPFAWS
jgi:hypothetical protein